MISLVVQSTVENNAGPRQRPLFCFETSTVSGPVLNVSTLKGMRAKLKKGNTKGTDTGL